MDQNNVPALPTGHPFDNVQLSSYWSATTGADNPTVAWTVIGSTGGVSRVSKTGSNLVWCVRGGQGHDAY